MNKAGYSVITSRIGDIVMEFTVHTLSINTHINKATYYKSIENGEKTENGFEVKQDDNNVSLYIKAPMVERSGVGIWRAGMAGDYTDTNALTLLIKEISEAVDAEYNTYTTMRNDAHRLLSEEYDKHIPSRATAIKLAQTGNRVAVANFLNSADNALNYSNLMAEESIKAHNFSSATYLIPKSIWNVKTFLDLSVEHGDENILSWLLEEYAVDSTDLNEAKDRAVSLGNNTMVKMLSDALDSSNDSTEEIVDELVASICDRLPETLIDTYEGTKLQRLLRYIDEYLV